MKILSGILTNIHLLNTIVIEENNLYNCNLHNEEMD